MKVLVVLFDLKSQSSIKYNSVTHVLVMNSNLWRFFYDHESDEIIPSNEVYVYDTNGDSYWIISPKVAEVAQQHFNCNQLSGVPLENYGGAGTAGR